jgi:hypothetical protein
MYCCHTLARAVIRDWLIENHKTFAYGKVPSAVLDAWQDDAEAGQFVIEISTHYSVSGVPVTLDLRAYAVPLLGAP